MAESKKTKVLFVTEREGEILAVFPEEKEGQYNVKCYCHLGQHSQTGINYYKSLREAKPVDYQPLYDELVKEFGYDLDVLNAPDPIKHAFTSLSHEGRTIIIYHDGGIKIIEQGANWDNKALVVNIEPSEMEEILKALKTP